MINNFLDYLRYELNRSPLTVEAYATDISQFQKWIASDSYKNCNFKDVTTNDVRAWLSSLAKAGESPRTIRRKLIALRSFYRWMMKRNFITSSPLIDVPLPKISKPLPELIKPSEIENAIQVLEKEHFEDNQSPLKVIILELLYSLGIRRAELVGLNDSDISFSSGEIKVTGKRSKQRIVPAPNKLLDKIKNWQNFRDKNEVKKDCGDALLIVKGKRISPNQVYKIVKEALVNSSARKRSPHALRHSFASGMLNGGANLDSVKEFLGHSSLATTQIYTHISLNEIKKAYSSAHPRSNDSKK